MFKINKESILKKLATLKPIIRERYKGKEIELFGSYCREEETESSDIDILVDFNEDADLFHFIGLTQFLEEELQLKVDVVPKRALRSEIRKAVFKEAISV